MSYLSSLECDHDKALYKSTFTLPYITARPHNLNHVANRRRRPQTWQPGRVELDVDCVRFGFFRYKTDLKQAGADHSHRVGNGAFVDHDLQLTFAGVVHVHFTRNVTIIVPVPVIVPVPEIVSVTVSDILVSTVKSQKFKPIRKPSYIIIVVVVVVVVVVAPRTLRPSNDFTLLNGWICLHGVLD